MREGGGIGRRVRLRGVWLSVWVQVPSFTPNKMTQPFGWVILFYMHKMGLGRSPTEQSRVVLRKKLAFIKIVNIDNNKYKFYIDIYYLLCYNK